MTILQLQSLRRLLISLLRVGAEMLDLVEGELQQRGALRERVQSVVSYRQEDAR